MAVLDVLAWLLALALSVPMAVLILECLAALLPARRPRRSADRPRCAILVPAHNEEGGISRTVAALLPQLAAGDRLVVIADNCSDRTAEVAQQAGAAVIERQDATRRGKGYALDFGVRHLSLEQPDVVLIVDADCLVAPGSIDALVRGAAATRRPQQAAYTLDDPPGGNYKQQLSSFAFLFKNVIRPRGLARVGFPCLLMGTGMAFPWPALRDARLASGNIVEDMQLGVDLALEGYPACLCLDAQVTGELPSGDKAAVTQRKRWEHGHIQTLLTQVPRLFLGALRRLRLDLLGLALELSVPPLSMLFLLWAVGLIILFAYGWYSETWGPAVLLGSAAAGVVGGILLAWARFGRERLPITSLLAAPFYVLWKVPIYLAFVFRRERAWIRTERTTTPEPQPPGKP